MRLPPNVKNSFGRLLRRAAHCPRQLLVGPLPEFGRIGSRGRRSGGGGGGGGGRTAISVPERAPCRLDAAVALAVAYVSSSIQLGRNLGATVSSTKIGEEVSRSSSGRHAARTALSEMRASLSGTSYARTGQVQGGQEWSGPLRTRCRRCVRPLRTRCRRTRERRERALGEGGVAGVCERRGMGRGRGRVAEVTPFFAATQSPFTQTTSSRDPRRTSKHRQSRRESRDAPERAAIKLKTAPTLLSS